MILQIKIKYYCEILKKKDIFLSLLEKSEFKVRDGIVFMEEEAKYLTV